MARRGGKPYPDLGRGTLPRSRPSFITRTATDDADQLFRRSSLPRIAHSESADLLDSTAAASPSNPYEPLAYASPPEPRQDESTKKVPGHAASGQLDGSAERARSGNRKSKPPGSSRQTDYSLNARLNRDSRPKGEKSASRKTGTVPRPAGGTEKLDTFSGVFVPTALNVLSILMFIRFGFILGQSGVLGMMGMLIAAYLINLVTTMSISAVASNGTVRGGGAYYLISRSLGPEFGGSIGIVFYLGFVFNTGLNALGLIDCLNQNFGKTSGNWANFMPDSFMWQYLWGSIVLLICTVICLAGSAIFARASNGLLMVLLVATFSIPVSMLVLKPFELTKPQPLVFTGLSAQTLKENLLPHFTKGAAGSQLDGRENYADLFGILFPATGGIFAGASMSGDLKNPSKSIPKGTLYGLALTFVSYTLVILALAASITRESLYHNVNVVQDTNISGILILLGEFATSFFSALMGIIGPAKLLQAIARDSVLPGLSIFGQGTATNDEPTYAILLTFAAAQLTMLFDINRLASFITMTYLMTFFVTNLACFLLKISSAPNFRPSFHYFNWWTAAIGAVLSGATMFFVDGLYATGCIGILVVIFLLIHYTTPPKAWGDVSQSLIYHQVRKYLLRLKTEHVKFWRPQILLFVNDPRRGYKLIQFCNSLKKGALFILGHVIVTTNFGASVPEARRQQAAWAKYIDFSKIKAFVNVAISPSVEWGTRNIVLSAGLGGMRPNIVIMGFYNLQQFRQEQPLIDVPSPPPERKERTLRKRRRSRSQLKGALPTDTCHVEGRMDVQSYVMVLEDMILKLQINVAIATGFHELELPNPDEGNTKKYIDLWPIQMTAEIAAETDGQRQNVMTTNFDTYTLILQLGCILNTVPSWKKSYKLRVAVFVEYESDVEEERERVASLLDSLRIEAEILVFWLASGDLTSYQKIVNGTEIGEERDAEIEKVLEDEEWWAEIQKVRGRLRSGEMGAVDEISIADDIPWPSSSFQHGRGETAMKQFDGLRKILHESKRRASFSNLSSLGVSLGMRTHRLDDDLISRHASHASASEASDSSGDESSDGTSEAEESDDAGSNAFFLSGSERETLSNASDVDRRWPSEAKPVSSKKSSRASSKRSRQSRRLAAPISASSLLTKDLLSQSNIEALDVQQPVLGIEPPSDSSVQTDEGPRGRIGVPEDAEEISAMQQQSPSNALTVTSPGNSRSSSRVIFSSSPVPVANVTGEEEVGPSVMFAEEPHPRRHRNVSPERDARESGQGYSIYKKSGSKSPPAQGFPSAASVPLSFNDLPCRAQHLILNELINRNSEDTAVIFTTLPAPTEGTYKSEIDSLGYVSDLEVLCGGLPPMLLVHSNSMTVTMNL